MYFLFQWSERFLNGSELNTVEPFSGVISNFPLELVREFERFLSAHSWNSVNVSSLVVTLTERGQLFLHFKV